MKFSGEEKKVMARVTIEMPFDVPVEYTPENFNFRFNHGSWCGDNLVEYLDELRPEPNTGPCLCRLIKNIEYLREGAE